MKKLFSVLVILISISGFTSARGDNDLDGKIFYGKATEITPPYVDRMPRIYDEVIKFENGKLLCETFRNYSDADSYYSSVIDERRAIAYKVVTFNSFSTGSYNGESVSIEFTGNIIGDTRLNGTIIIRFPDNSELKFIVEAVSS
ncbi:MAG: hypothetical protein JST15_13340 [Bacteroidetes bacterium]|nr:hypothetical protein [Bacteroidota bacterium]